MIVLNADTITDDRDALIAYLIPGVRYHITCLVCGITHTAVLIGGGDPETQVRWAARKHLVDRHGWAKTDPRLDELTAPTRA